MKDQEIRALVNDLENRIKKMVDDAVADLTRRLEDDIGRMDSDLRSLEYRVDRLDDRT